MSTLPTSIVTGGAGFIGSHISERLLALGHHVIIVDNLLTGLQKNISDLEKQDNLEFLKQDAIQSLPKLSRVDYIFHLASPASVVDYQKYPEETALVNSLGTRNFLTVAREHHARFVLASTSEIYGDPKVHPQKESYWGNVNPIGPRACYDEAKRFGEMMTMLYKDKYAVDVRIVRIFNTYGPRMRPDDGRVVSNFVTQALGNKPITVYGDGSQTRSLCYVDDLVEELVKAMLTDQASGHVINLGNPHECAVVDLAKKIIQMTHSTSTIKYSSLPEDDPIQRQPDISKARELLGWNPKVPLEDGLEKTIDYYKKSSAL